MKSAKRDVKFRQATNFMTVWRTRSKFLAKLGSHTLAPDHQRRRSPTMAVDHRPKIIESVFSRRNAAGELEESYVSHVKIWEEAENNSRKPRYILLSRAYNASPSMESLADGSQRGTRATDLSTSRS